MDISLTYTQMPAVGALLVGVLIGISLCALINWIISRRLMSVPIKTQKAMSKLTELLKKDLIDKQPISVARIYRLIRSVGRREGINLALYIAPTVPLEDVELSLKEDGKLDLKQKEECIIEIEKILNEMSMQKGLIPLPIELSEIIKSLKEKIQKGLLDEVNEEIVKLQLWYESTDFGRKAILFRLRVIASLTLLLLVWIITGVISFFFAFPHGYNWWIGWTMIICPVLILSLFAIGYFNIWKDQDKI